MSLPPTTVQIKRKRNAEPPDFLRVHETGSREVGSPETGKRQKHAGWVFERRVEPNTNVTITQTDLLLGARPIKPIKTLSRAGSSQSLVTKNQSLSQSTLAQVPKVVDDGRPKEAEAGHPTQTLQAGNGAVPASNVNLQKQPAQVRRFHISRTPASQNSPNGPGQARKRKTAPTIFVERRERLKTPEDPNQQQTSQPLLPDSQPATPSQPQKRPGRSARTQLPRTPNATSGRASPLPERNTDVPSALRDRWNVNSEDLVAQMQAYTLQEIGYNIAEAGASRETASGPSTPVINRFASNKFKPTAPKLRYSQRHPEEVKEASASESMEVEYDSDVEMNSDEDYVVDTYIRVPVDTLQLTTCNIGLLVLDSEVDIEEFYRGDEESDEEDDLEDEDENAENHYSADYPDEEVDSDDEYGRNAYNYRLNGSDDEFDATYSDSENEETKYPWKTKEKAWMAQIHDDFE